MPAPRHTVFPAGERLSSCMNRWKFLQISFAHLADRVTALASDYLDETRSRPVAPAYGRRRGATPVSSSAARAGPRRSCARPSAGDRASLAVAECDASSDMCSGSGEPVGAVGDLLASVINQNVTAWRSGPAAVTIEQTVVSWLSQAVGCPGFRGYLTGGGSSANLMGLAMAREAKTPANEKGISRWWSDLCLHRSAHVDSEERGATRHRARQLAPDSHR